MYNACVSVHIGSRKTGGKERGGCPPEGLGSTFVFHRRALSLGRTRFVLCKTGEEWDATASMQQMVTFFSFSLSHLSRSVVPAADEQADRRRNDTCFCSTLGGFGYVSGVRRFPLDLKCAAHPRSPISSKRIRLQEIAYVLIKVSSTDFAPLYKPCDSHCTSFPLGRLSVNALA